MAESSEACRRAIVRARARLEAAGLTIAGVDDGSWRVCATNGLELIYWPLEDRWRNGSKWGRGTVTLIAELAGELRSAHG